MASELSRAELAIGISEIVNVNDPFKVRPYAEAIMAHDAALRERVEELENINAKHVLNAIEIVGQFADLKTEITRLSELLWGSRCVYCGEILGKDKQNQDQADEVLRKHVWNCPKHPLQSAKQQLAALTAKVDVVENKLAVKRQLLELEEEKVARLTARCEAAEQELLLWRDAHVAGCPTIADDDSDMVLDDCGICTCLSLKQQLAERERTITSLTRDLENGFMDGAYARLKVLQEKERELDHLKETQC